MHEDRYGLPLSTSSPEAAEAYRDGHDLLLSSWPGAAEAFERAIGFDPEFALAYAARARVHAIYQQTADARRTIATADECAAKRGTARERSHVGILSLAINGKSAAALEAVLTHIETWPRDAIMVSLPLGAFGLYAFSGRADHDQARQDLCTRYASAYGDDWWFLCNYGWSLTENGDVKRGRALTERSFALRRQNAYTAHALLHAMFEDGAIDEADALVTNWIGGYDRSGVLYGHIYWHQALGALDQGDTARALAIHTDVLRPLMASAPPVNALSDGSSLLWRLQAEGHAVPRALWAELDTYAKDRFPQSSLPFVEMHMALIAAATQDRAALDTRLNAIEQRLAQGTLAAGPVVPRMCRALRAFADGDYKDSVSELAPVLADVVRLGGSHAQRELIEDTFIAALIRSGELAQARIMLDARLHRRPSGRDTRWRGMTAEL